MEKIENYLDRNLGLLQIIGALMAGLITLTAYAHTTFATKDDVKLSISDTKEILIRIEKNVDKIDDKVDRILENK